MDHSHSLGTVRNLLRDPDGFCAEEMLEIKVFRDERPDWRPFSVSIMSEFMGWRDSVTCLSPQAARRLGELLVSAADLAAAREAELTLPSS